MYSNGLEISRIKKKSNNKESFLKYEFPQPRAFQSVCHLKNIPFCCDVEHSQCSLKME